MITWGGGGGGGLKLVSLVFKQNETESRKDSCFSGDHRPADTTCHIEEPQQEYHLRLVSNDYLGGGGGGA